MRRAASLLASLCSALHVIHAVSVGVGSAVSASVTFSGVVQEKGNQIEGSRHTLVRRALQFPNLRSADVNDFSSKTTVTSHAIHPYNRTCPPRWKVRGHVCLQLCKKKNFLGRLKNGQCKCATDDDCLSGLRCADGGFCTARPKSPCPSMWFEAGGELCFQGCSRDDQHRDGDGRCLCGQGLPNQDCFPGTSCNGGVCETPRSLLTDSLASSLAFENEEYQTTGACSDFSGYYRLQGSAVNPLGFNWSVRDTWNPGICNTALPGPTGDDPDSVSLGLANNHGYELPSIIEEIQGYPLKEVVIIDEKNEELDRKCCQQCAMTTLCEYWSREVGTGKRKCYLGYSPGKHIKHKPQ